MIESDGTEKHSKLLIFVPDLTFDLYSYYLGVLIKKKEKYQRRVKNRVIVGKVDSLLHDDAMLSRIAFIQP